MTYVEQSQDDSAISVNSFAEALSALGTCSALAASLRPHDIDRPVVLADGARFSNANLIELLRT